MYTHITPSSMDAKDWFDDYNNEEIYISDDVGASGVSQWRTYINIVAPIKLPLPCADAKLKNTKYFQSNIVLLTTNRFMNIHSVTSADCIGDLTALHRRGVVFDFKGVAMSVDGFSKGSVALKVFDLNTNEFVSRLPRGFKQHPSGKDLTTYVSLNGTMESQIQLLRWMYQVINVASDIKKKQHDTNILSDKTLSFIRGENIKAESLLDSIFSQNFNTDTPSEEDDEDVMYDYINEIYTKPQIVESIQNEDSQETMIKNTIMSNWFTSYIKETFMSVTKKLMSFVAQRKDAIWEYLPHVAISLMGVTLISYIVKWFRKPVFSAQTQMFKDDKYEVSSLHTKVQSLLTKHVFELEIFIKTSRLVAFGVVSGEYIIFPSHLAIEDSMVVSMYTKDRKTKVLDKDVSIVYRNNEFDVCVGKIHNFMATPFKKLVLGNGDKNLCNLLLLNSSGVLPYPAICRKKDALNGVYIRDTKGYTVFKNQFLKERDLFYNVRGAGMCGTTITDDKGCILGMHVAGDDSSGLGVAIIWNDQVKRDIETILHGSFEGVSELRERDELSNISIVPLDKRMYLSVPKTTNLAPSELYGIFPESSRSPVNFLKYGEGTLHEVMKKSMEPCVYIPSDELAFAKECIKDFFPQHFDLLSEKEVIDGNSDKKLAGLNMKSVNGYNNLYDKDSYIDRVNCQYTPLLRKQLEEIRANFEGKEYPQDYFTYTATLKDELKDKGKDPRAFCVGTIQHQVLCKQYFGNIVSYIMANRDFNQIQVGINPFKEWDTLYKKVDKCKIKWAGDISKWDGKMSIQVSNMVIDLFVDALKEPLRDFARFVLSPIIHTHLEL
jgi:hypothetical protein